MPAIEHRDRQELAHRGPKNQETELGVRLAKDFPDMRATAYPARNSPVTVPGRRRASSRSAAKSSRKSRMPSQKAS